MGEDTEKTLRFEHLRELAEHLEQTEDDAIVSVIIESGVRQGEAEV